MISDLLFSFVLRIDVGLGGKGPRENWTYGFSQKEVVVFGLDSKVLED
jgi:hypothetical protein